MKTKIVLLITFFLNVFLVHSQESKIEKADKKYEQLAFIDAIKIYEKVAEKGYKSKEIFQKIGNSYYFQGKLVEANKWYAELFSLNTNIEPEYYFRYGQTLKSVGNNKKADEILAHFYLKNPKDNRAKIGNSQLNYLAEIDKNSGRYTFENAGINSKYSDFGTTFYNDELVFASSRNSEKIFSRKHSWTNQSFTNLFQIKLDSSKINTPEKFSENVNSKYNESSPIFTKDGKTMYFTRNNFLNKKKGTSKEQTILLKIYKATKINEEWINVTELPFNSNNYNVAHPALSADEKTLFFVSNMPGTVGNIESDIYKVSINKDGSYGKPINLGSKINTEGRETFPFITENNELYFASDGHPGLGGLDVFVAQLLPDESVGAIKNVGKPINSNHDDFAFYMNTITKTGFVSSNRKEDNLGFDDIYKFTEIRPIPKDCEQLLTGIVIDIDTRKSIAYAKVTLYDSEENKLKEMDSDINGTFNFGTINCGENYKIRAQKTSYTTNEIKVSIPNESGITTIDIPLELSVKPVTFGDDLRKSLGIDIIYFDLDQAEIRPDAAVELAKVLEVLKQYPTMKIDVRSHTDCRQTASYNLVLSEKRAKSTLNWLLKNGISKERLTGKGYGETQLVNNCACEPTNDSNCDEETHQKNRRSQFIITNL